MYSRDAAHIQQHVAAQGAIPLGEAALLAPCFLTPEQSAEVFNLGAEC